MLARHCSDKNNKARTFLKAVAGLAFILVLVFAGDVSAANFSGTRQPPAPVQQSEEPGLTADQLMQSAPSGDVSGYTLGPGDRVRIIVFGEDNLSGEFEVDGTGKISMPLIGDVEAANRTIREVGRSIEASLSNGYLRDPKVSVDVLNYRPFFILGEVMKPGSYPYVNGMTVVNAVALAGGYTYRADKDDITIVRAGDTEKREERAPETAQVMPGDIVRVPERFF